MSQYSSLQTGNQQFIMCITGAYLSLKQYDTERCYAQKETKPRQFRQHHHKTHFSAS